MKWLIYALFCAIFMSLSEIFEKRGLFIQRSLEFVFARSAFGFLLLIVLIPFIDWNISIISIILVFVVSILFVIADFYRARAYKHMDISAAAPFYNLLPAFVAGLSFLFLGEIITFTQVLGICTLVVGAYVLEVDHNVHSLLNPIKKIIKSKYIHIIFLVLFFIGISSLFEKHIIDFHLKPLQFLFLFFLFMSLNFFILNFIFSGWKGIKKSFKKAKTDAFFSGLFWVLEIYAFFQALTFQMVSLVMPIKRLHTIFTTIGGGTIFKDKGLYLKAVACIIMFVGVLLIVL